MKALINKLKARLALKAKQVRGGPKAVIHLLFAICLCSCLPERFRHEKYDCSGSLHNTHTIILNKAKTGEYAKIVNSSSEAKANITKIDDQTAWLVYNNIQLKINRKTGAITMIQGTRYKKVVCKKTVFKM